MSGQPTSTDRATGTEYGRLAALWEAAFQEAVPDHLIRFNTTKAVCTLCLAPHAGINRMRGMNAGARMRRLDALIDEALAGRTPHARLDPADQCNFWLGFYRAQRERRPNRLETPLP